MKNTKMAFKVASVGALVLACGLAQAQTTITFEPPLYTGSAAGTDITGQDGWYVPAVANSIHGNVYTFAGNPYGIPASPVGGTQFEAGECDGTNFVRAQHAVNFTGGSGVFQVSVDMCGTWNPTNTAAATDNLGSFSYQDSTVARYYQTLMNWGSGAVVVGSYPGGPATLTNYATTKDKFHVAMGYFTTPTGAIVFSTPTASWADRPINHWYRTTIKWDFASSAILKVAITDLTAGTPTEETDVSNRGWFLRGGLNSTFPTPTDVRLFTGSTLAGNVAAWDNYTYGVATADTGACCLAAGGCSVLTSVACLTGGGTYAGDNVTCAAAACPPPGACCLPTGACISATAASCSSQGGIYRGVNTVCADAACQVFRFDADLTQDVGDLLGNAAQITGRGTPITQIQGNIDLDDTDTYKLQICDRAAFSATTVGGTTLDTMLWLFDANGFGKTMDDDDSATVPQSRITGQFVTTNGTYYLSISTFENTAPAHGRVAWDASAQPIWNPTNPGGAVFPEWAPNGPGAANALATWSGSTSALGSYTIATTGVCSLGCYANCDGSTATPRLTANDFQCFLNAFATKEGYANCDGSTANPVLTANDFQCFLNAYAAGCNN